MPAPETRFAVLLFTDIVGSTELKARHGVPAYSEALRKHNGHFERIARECLNLRTLQSRGDGYFAEAGSIAEAVRFALLFEDALRNEPWGDVRLAVRIGIHAGEVGTLAVAATPVVAAPSSSQEVPAASSPPAVAAAPPPQDGVWIVGPAADLAARITDLAMGGQILLTRFPFDEARHFIREHPPVAGKTMPPLRWLAHGPYLLKGRDEPMDIFEVGADGIAPLTAPPDGDKAKRAIRPGEEETLGWRPAVGLEIPGRTGWHLTRRLGAGGFGEVWVGEHAKLRQRRAFKFCFDDERLRALKREVTLVRLLRSALGERDDIVHIHELKLDAPPFYLESDLAPHGNLLQWAERQGGLEKIPLAQRIALVAHTATALAAAHSIGVLHKDIKPTNILIFDGPGGEPRPRLVDFGIGTLADPAVLGEHGVTAAGFTHTKIEHSTGTPTYSPPEYLAGRPYTIQGDIYGLGVLLYQLITGKSNEPLAHGWEREIADLLLREDIAACVEGDPARRLPSASDLADRLLHLDQRRADIAEKERLARESAARAEAEAAATAAGVRATRLRKLAAAFAVLALLAIAGGVLAWMNQEKAINALGEVEKRNQKIQEGKLEVDRKNTEYRAMLAEAARSDRFFAEAELQTGKEREAFAHLARACEYDANSTVAAEMAVAALTVWQHLFSVAVLAGNEGAVWSAQFSPDGMRIVTASEDETARIWDAETGKCLATLAGHKDRVWDAQFSPDGSRIVTRSADTTARVWDTATGKALLTLAGHKKEIRGAGFSPDGTRIATASGDGTARVWEVTTGNSLVIFAEHGGAVQSTQFSPDGTRIVTAAHDNTARVWDAATGKTLTTLTGHNDAVMSAQFSPDGSRIVTASYDKTARVWDTATGDSLVILSGHQDQVWSAQFSPDGSSIVTCSTDKTAKIWDAASGKCLATVAGSASYGSSAEFSRDGSRVAAAAEDGSVQVWDAVSGKRLAILAGHNARVSNVQFSPDGTRIVTASADKTARVWDAVTAEHSTTLAGHQNSVQSARYSPDGTRIVTASEDKTSRVWDTATGKSLITLSGHNHGVMDAQFNSNGNRIVTASDDWTARVWDAATGRSLASPAQHRATVRSAQFSPDGSRIVTASDDKTVQVWDVATGKSLIALTVQPDVQSAQFSPDGSHILTAGGDYFAKHGEARLWYAATGKTFVTFAGHEHYVISAQFSPDGTRVVTASEDKTARVWDVGTGKSLVTFAGHDDRVWSAQFSPDGTRIVTTSSDCTVRLWDATNGKSLSTLGWHTPFATWDDSHSIRNWSKIPVRTAYFSPDGTRIVTSSGDGTARIWNILTPAAGPPPEWFPDFLRYMAQMRLNSDGELETLKPDDWLALRERMRGVRRAGVGQDTPYLRILRRFVPE